MDPPVPNYGRARRGPVLVPGMALAIEPMLVLGSPETAVLADDWTVVTVDGSWAAHFEHTVAITDEGPVVLTAEDGGAAGFAALRAGQLSLSPQQVGITGAVVTAEGARNGI
jgi:methionyl aminopeptidase